MNLKKETKYSFFAIITTLMIMLFFVGCVPQPSTDGRRTASDSQISSSDIDETELRLTDDPVHTNDYNYIQHGQLTYTSQISLSKSFSDSLYLRGNDIHSYVKAASLQNQTNRIL